MEFDLTATPPRAPQPTFLVVNPQTGLIDFSLAGTPLPDDCATQTALTQAQCQFDQWLQTLNGFPTVTPASAPASAPLDPATLTLGQNVVVVGAEGKRPGDRAWLSASTTRRRRSRSRRRAPGRWASSTGWACAATRTACATPGAARWSARRRWRS